MGERASRDPRHPRLKVLRNYSNISRPRRSYQQQKTASLDMNTKISTMIAVAATLALMLVHANAVKVSTCVLNNVVTQTSMH